MNLGKPHLIASLVLLALAVMYNVYEYMGSRPPARGAGAVVEPITPAGEPVPANGAGSVDPMQLPAPPDVALDRVPDWSTSPFAHVRPAATLEPAGTAAQPVVEAEPDVVVAAILYAADRRVAMINGRIVRAGDTVGPVTIVEILPNAVVVDSPVRGRRTVELQSPRSPVRPQ